MKMKIPLGLLALLFLVIPPSPATAQNGREPPPCPYTRPAQIELCATPSTAEAFNKLAEAAKVVDASHPLARQLTNRAEGEEITDLGLRVHLVGDADPNQRMLIFHKAAQSTLMQGAMVKMEFLDANGQPLEGTQPFYWQFSDNYKVRAPSPSGGGMDIQFYSPGREKCRSFRIAVVTKDGYMATGQASELPL